MALFPCSLQLYPNTLSLSIALSLSWSLLSFTLRLLPPLLLSISFSILPHSLYLLSSSFAFLYISLSPLLAIVLSFCLLITVVCQSIYHIVTRDKFMIASSTFNQSILIKHSYKIVVSPRQNLSIYSSLKNEKNIIQFFFNIILKKHNS